jgi:hypothetical protein
MSAPFASVTNEDALTDAVLAMANKNAERLSKMSHRRQHKYVRNLVLSTTVVFVCWHESGHTHFYCIKGRGLLGLHSTTAFAVEDRADAIAMAEDLGDGDAPHLAYEMPAGVM